jgi:hypothetical protein
MGARVTDDFNRASIGTNWTSVTGATASLAIASNQCESTHPSTPANMYYNADTPPADQYAKLTLKTVDTSSDEGFGPAVRIATGAQTEYFMQATTSEIRMYKLVAGGFTQLGSDAAAGASNDILQLNAVGTSITGKKAGATIIGPVTDSGIASGRYGIWAWNSTAIDITADDWEGGDFSGTTNTKSISESFLLTDVLTGVKIGGSQNKSILENITITEDGTFKEWVISMAPETLTVADTLSKFMACGKVLSESIAVADTETKWTLRNRLISESISVIDQVTRQVLATRSISESITLIDTLSKLIITGTVHQSSISETITITEQLLAYSYHVRSILESIVANDSLGRAATRNRQQLEAFSLLDLLTSLYVPYNPSGAVQYDPRFMVGADALFTISADSMFLIGGSN